jgi:diaminopimelate decarboxylase
MCRAQYGDAFYVLHMERFENNAARFLGEFSAKYPRTRLAYSYKTNYIPDLVTAADRLGFYAEVVSHHEYLLARSLGVSAENIIYNGPIKSRGSLFEALDDKSTVNVDNLEELEEIRSLLITGELQKASIGLRVNFDLDGSPSRFGLCVESGEFEAACDIIRQAQRISVTGLHCHFSVPGRGSASYHRRTRTLIELASSVPNPAAIRFLDVGGGFAGILPQELQPTHGGTYPSWTEYAEAVAGEMARAFPDGDGPELILEPGIGLLGDTMDFVCMVYSVKRSLHEVCALTTGSMFNVKPFFGTKDPPITHIPSPHTVGRDSNELFQITGYTCMEIDVLYRDFEGCLRRGDFLVFSNCGAYAPMLAPPFIRGAPPVVAFGKHLRLIRRGADENDMLSTYRDSARKEA